MPFVASLRPTAVGFDTIAVRIDDECSVVVGPVVGTHARLAVVASAGAYGRGVKAIHALARCRLKAEMQTRLVICRDRMLADADPQGDGIASVAERGG